MGDILVNSRGGRRWVISDVHGCLKTLQTLVEDKIALTQDDQLFLLGDYINRGNASAGVLDYIMNLLERQYQVFPLRGNHEQMLLDAWNDYQQMKNVGEETSLASRLMGGFDLLDEKGELQAKYARFVFQLPYYYELDRFYLVHAGFNYKVANPLQDYSSMIWMRNFQINPTTKIVVHGHQIRELDEIEHKIETRSSILPLDNGCYYGLDQKQVHLNILAGRRIGNLCGLDLDTYQLIVQPNVDAE